MSFIAAIRKKKSGQVFKTLVPIALLLFYISGTFGSEVLHELNHQHKVVVSHSEQEEKNPCHRQLFHEDKDAGCSHHSHFLQTDKCKLCDHLSHVDQAILSDVQYSSFQFSVSPLVRGQAFTPVLTSSGLSSRAPPVI